MVKIEAYYPGLKVRMKRREESGGEDMNVESKDEKEGNSNFMHARQLPRFASANRRWAISSCSRLPSSPLYFSILCIVLKEYKHVFKHSDIARKECTRHPKSSVHRKPSRSFR